MKVRVPKTKNKFKIKNKRMKATRNEMLDSFKGRKLDADDWKNGPNNFEGNNA